MTVKLDPPPFLGEVPLSQYTSARLSNAFSPAVMGDIGAGNPRSTKSKGGMVGNASLKCGGVLGPATLMVVSGEELGWEPNGWLD